MSKTERRVDPKAFQQEESNADQLLLLQALEPRLNKSAAPRVALVLIF